MPAAAPAGEVRDLGHGIYQLPTDYPDVCNAPLWTYLLADTGRFGLVDPGIASTREATLTAAIQQAGFAPGQADILLATHGHPDHSGGQGTWRGVAPGARIAAPLEDTAWVESFDKQWTRFWDDYPGVMDLRDTRDFLAGLCRPEPRVDVLLRDGDTVTVGARPLNVVETRGHTWGHCAYFDPASGVLFTGDAVQGHGTPSCDGTSVFAPLYLDVEEARQRPAAPPRRPVPAALPGPRRGHDPGRGPGLPAGQPLVHRHSRPDRTGDGRNPGPGSALDQRARRSTRRDGGHQPPGLAPDRGHRAGPSLRTGERRTAGRGVGAVQDIVRWITGAALSRN